MDRSAVPPLQPAAVSQQIGVDGNVSTSQLPSGWHTSPGRGSSGLQNWITLK